MTNLNLDDKYFKHRRNSGTFIERYFNTPAKKAAVIVILMTIFYFLLAVGTVYTTQGTNQFRPTTKPSKFNPRPSDSEDDISFVESVLRRKKMAELEAAKNELFPPVDQQQPPVKEAPPVQADVPVQKTRDVYQGPPPESRSLESLNLPPQARAQLNKKPPVSAVQPASPAATKGKADPDGMAMVKKMMNHAWSNYVKYAWGQDELRPVSKQGRQWLGTSGIAATIVDSLDTLYIMNMMDDFKRARDYVEKELNFDINSGVSVFETTIRVVGGLLSAFDLTGDEMFIQRASEISDRIMPAFDTPTGMPNAVIDLHTGNSWHHSWASGAILAEVGSVQLEYQYLSDVSGDQTYGKKAFRSMQGLLDAKKRIPGLYPTVINNESGEYQDGTYTVGGLADSFYEYLLKIWLIEDKTDAKWRKLWDEAALAIDKYLIAISGNDDTYLTAGTDTYKQDDMEHLTCFAGGMFALASVELKDEYSDRWLSLGAKLTETCYKMYTKSPTGIAAEKTRIPDFSAAARYYILRPEALESIFYMWRITHDQKYRDWAMTIAKSIESVCKTDSGYSGLNDVTVVPPQKNDNQESFFLAETLKYLYLIYTEDDVISLDKYVFNTEAHPLSKKKYRRSIIH